MTTNKPPRFVDKTVLITGGSSGIGLAAAHGFLNEGASSVTIVGRNQNTLDNALQELGPKAHAMRVDLSQPTEIKRLFEDFTSRHGHLDVLFANAGRPQLAPVADTSVELFDSVIAGNFRAGFFTAKYALPLLRNGSAVVFTTSFFDQKGIPGSSVISASKAATRSLTRTLAAELVDRGVRVNAVAPGSIDTPAMGNMGLTPEQQQESVRANIPQIPMGRVGHAEEVANAAIFLASDDASYITGSEITVDGGRLQL